MRASSPDGRKGGRLVLVKHVSRMRLTYQVRLLTEAAEELGGRLEIHLPAYAAISRDLGRFQRQHRRRLKIVRRR